MSDLRLANKDAVVFLTDKVAFSLDGAIVLALRVIQCNSNPFACQHSEVHTSQHADPRF